MRIRLTPVLTRARDLARDLNLALDLDLASDLDFLLVLVRDLARALARNLKSALDELQRALSDFTRANLRNADLVWASLDGLRWSATTRWPLNWVERIERDSVEVEPGIFEIRGGTMYAPTTV